MSINDHIIYALLWLSFGALHSILAGNGAKFFFASVLGARYRLAYNIFAVFHIGLVMVIGKIFLAINVTSFVFAGLPGMIFNVALVLGPLIIFTSLLEYDLGRFSGMSQIRAARDHTQISDNEPLHVEGLHQYVRHPLYAGGFLLLFGLISDEFSLATAIWGSLYLLIGTWFEELKLLEIYGAAYETYRRQVPAFFPWRGKVTTASP